MGVDHRRSVAQLHVTFRKPDAFQPWELLSQRQAGGSACVVGERRLLTCAHVIEHALHVEVTRPGDAKRYTARVELVDHERELALVTVDDAQFFDGMVPVALGGLPVAQTEVSVWGFPGGHLTTTSGIITRVDVIPYTHSQRRLLALQTDAVVNPGNSGGPVFLDDKLVGIALQGAGPDEDDTSHLIPVPIVEHFLADVADGRISGVPDLGIRWQKIENPSLLAFVGLEPEHTGILVTQVAAASSADGVIHPGDVITSIDGVPIACDGTVLQDDDLRLEHSVLVSRRQIGEVVAVGVVRDRRASTVEVTLSARVAAMPLQDGKSGSYFIGGGLVFQRLTYEFVRRWAWDRTDPRFKVVYVHEYATHARHETVVLSQVLAHEVNVGYHDVFLGIVIRINGRPIASLADVVRAWERPDRAFQVVELESVSRESTDTPACLRLVLDAERARATTAELLARHAIPRDRSPDLDAAAR